MWGVLGNIVCDLDPKIKVKGKKRLQCDCVPLSAALNLVSVVFAGCSNLMVL